MTEKQIKNYGENNFKAFEDYSANFLGDKALDIDSIKNAKDIPEGTILFQSWLNSKTFYKVVRTTAQSVEMIKLPDLQVDFECAGGPTGYNYIMPNFEKENVFAKDKILKRVKKTEDGIYIPGVQQGYWCSNMYLWNGEPVSEYWD